MTNPINRALRFILGLTFLPERAVIRDPMGNPVPSAGGNAFAGGELVLDDVTDVEAR